MVFRRSFKPVILPKPELEGWPALTQKNIVFILTDTLRRDKISVYNEKVDFTDNLEEFGEEAAVFDQAVAQAPWTLPSHASIFTGMYPWEHGATQRNLELEVEKPLLAEKLDHRSMCVSVNGWLIPDFGLTDGFDQVENFSTEGLSGLLTKAKRKLDNWLSEPGMDRLKRLIVRPGEYIFHYWTGGSQTPKIFDLSRDFIEEEDDDFFLFVNLMDAHEPYFPPEKYMEKHDCVNPRTVCQDHTDHETGRKEADFDEIHKLYDACVDFMDDQIGEFFDYLQAQGLWEDTIVIVGSDHGQMLGEENHYGHQYSVAEPLVHVPLMVKGLESSQFEDLFELRQLYSLIPELVEGDATIEKNDYALGGYEFPDMYRPRIPKDRWTEFYQRLHFARSPDGRVTRSEKEKGETSYSFENFDSELSSAQRNKLRDQLDIITDVEVGKGLEDQDEQIKSKLKDLGYG